MRTLVQKNHDPGFYASIGMASWLMTKSPEYAQFPTGCISAWIEPAVIHGHIHFFYGAGDKPAGYVTWALLAPDTEDRLIHDPGVLFHISEWNEGGLLWVMDLVLIDLDVRAAIREIREMFANFSVARCLRRFDDGTVRKVTTWKAARGANP